MKEPEKRNAASLAWRWSLSPLGCLYLGVSRLRAKSCSRRGSVSLGKPVISIGNLTFGGTGKTPVAIAIAKRLSAMGEQPTVLLRGYGRKTKGALPVDGSSTFAEVGEEALLLKRNLPETSVVVGERREEAAALAGNKASVFVLDDAYQHLRVHRDLDILLVDASSPGDLRTPPVGRLRELLCAARRADLVIVTRGKAAQLPACLEPYVSDKTIIGAVFEWEMLVVNGKDRSSIDNFVGRPVTAFAAVGNPDAFFAQAESLGFALAGRRSWPDHAVPNPARLRVLLSEARRTGAQAVLTTEKDAIKWLPTWPGDPPLLYPRLRVLFDDIEGRLGGLLSRMMRKP